MVSETTIMGHPRGLVILFFNRNVGTFLLLRYERASCNLFDATFPVF